MENQFTEEQQDALDKMLIRQGYLFQGYESLAFLERELGKVHRVTCAFRKDVIPALEAKSNASKERMDETGATAVLSAIIVNTK